MRPLEASRQSRPIVFRIGPELNDKIEQAAKTQGLTRSEFLRRATELFLKDNSQALDTPGD